MLSVLGAAWSVLSARYLVLDGRFSEVGALRWVFGRLVGCWCRPLVLYMVRVGDGSGCCGGVWSMVACAATVGQTMMLVVVMYGAGGRLESRRLCCLVGGMFVVSMFRS